MNTYKVTFIFEKCTAVVIVNAASEQQAIAMARVKEVGKPVPEHIAATVKQVEHGGAREGSGNRKRRKLVAEPRTIKKQIRWTAAEWQQIKSEAARLGMTAANYQRMRILTHE